MPPNWNNRRKQFSTRVGNRLAVITYEGEEYKQSLTDLKAALEHHYVQNTHHPEHYPNGVDGMSLLDLIEMLMDWKAASERHPGGMNIAYSIDLSSQRFSVGEQLPRPEQQATKIG